MQIEASIPTDKEEFSVFYSWQSDLPNSTNQQFIRSGLQRALADLEEAANGRLKTKLDEATRDVPGSPNIPQSIFDKISRCSVFVCDITTINAERPTGSRATPNPNVLIELGFAVAVLGWNRVVAIFNEGFGVFPQDVPFDFDRHRIGRYTRILEAERQKGKNDQEKKRLHSLLMDAIGAVLAHDPKRPGQLILDPAAVKRSRDIRCMTRMMGEVHIPSFEFFVHRVQMGYIPDDIFHYWEGFNGVVTSTQFHLYDDGAKKIALRLHKAWRHTLSFDEHFRAGPNADQYYFQHSYERQDKSAAVLEEITKSSSEAESAMSELLDHIRTQYLEIDLEHTSKQARQDYLSYYKKAVASNDDVDQPVAVPPPAQTTTTRNKAAKKRRSDR